MKQVIQAVSCDPFVIQPDSWSIFNQLYWSETPALERLIVVSLNLASVAVVTMT